MPEPRPPSWYFLLAIILRSAQALVCPVPSQGGVPRNKTCPDFKADPSFIYCCTSKLPLSSAIYKDRHGVFCCSEADFLREQQEIADAEFKNFIKDYLLLLILSCLAGSCVLVIVASFVCRRVRRCPLYAHPSTRLGHLAPQTTSSMYRPVDTIPPKIYEAPPPYECFVPPPVAPTEGNDWNCVLENEVNGGRRPAPAIAS